MAEEPCSPHGWTLDTLETYLSDKIASLDRYCQAGFSASEKQVNLALTSSDKAVSKAEIATDKRFDGVNELRGAMSDQAKLLLPRQEYLVQHEALSQKLDSLSGTVTHLRTDFTTLQATLNGKSQGIGVVGTIILGSLAALGTGVGVVALVLELFRH